jgi:manganese-transporting P-type ATPase
MSSILGQFAIHIGALFLIMSRCYVIHPRYARESSLERPYTHYVVSRAESINIEQEYSPSLLNSAIFLLSLTMQVATFAVNYQGHPFRESLYENRPLFKSLSIVFGIGVFAATEISRDFNKWFQLTSFPPSVSRLSSCVFPFLMRLRHLFSM